jgi:uncharacterized membrane protein
VEDLFRPSARAAAVLFFVISTAVSFARWANFEYRTFDLAYYVQGLWQLLRWRFDVSILQTPLLGNHVEPIVLLFAPVFALLPHPITLVALQNGLLALLGPIGYDIARHLRFTRAAAAAVATALLLAPATGYVALHEFHPEALTAPFLLLMFRARLVGSVKQHWLWFCAVLACKENMAVLLVAYCAAGALGDRANGWAWVRRWSIWPALVAIAWLILCMGITRALNSGNIDYVSLYDRLGATPQEIVRNAFVDPGRFFRALSGAIGSGNLLSGTLLPFLCLPLLRPRWMIVAAPVLLQHLLSWRSSEWMIYFHYGAPLVAIFWFASVEAIDHLRRWDARLLASALPFALLVAACAAQAILGPVDAVLNSAKEWRQGAFARQQKNALLAEIPPHASVVAPLPYLSHLAMREHCHSLHFILKGLKTLGRARYIPPESADVVLIDYGDSATFDAAAGYYHPTMKTAEGEIVPSSERLLHEFLARSSWTAKTKNEYVLLARSERLPPIDAPPTTGEAIQLGEGNTLVALRRGSETDSGGDTMTILLDWSFEQKREIFPWLELVLWRDGTTERHILTKGLCAPEVAHGPVQEKWLIRFGDRIAPGSYNIEARFVDNSKRAWATLRRTGAGSNTLLSLPLGRAEIPAIAPRGSR